MGGRRDGTAEALTLRRGARLIAPEPPVAECGNIIWKKVRRDELSSDEAFLAARLFQAADIEFLPSVGEHQCSAPPAVGRNSNSP
jgi:predicted nucleic acid-binding protein